MKLQFWIPWKITILTRHLIVVQSNLSNNKKYAAMQTMELCKMKINQCLNDSDGFELEFSGSSKPELKIFRAELGHFNFELKPSWKWADNMHINWEQILDPI